MDAIKKHGSCSFSLQGVVLCWCIAAVFQWSFEISEA